MRYIKFTAETPYCGTTETEYIAFPDNTPDEFLTEYSDELAKENGETYEYLATGWEDELEEEEREEVLNDYYDGVNGFWEEVNKEEWEENDGKIAR